MSGFFNLDSLHCRFFRNCIVFNCPHSITAVNIPPQWELFSPRKIGMRVWEIGWMEDYCASGMQVHFQLVHNNAFAHVCNGTTNCNTLKEMEIEESAVKRS